MRKSGKLRARIWIGPSEMEPSTGPYPGEGTLSEELWQRSGVQMQGCPCYYFLGCSKSSSKPLLDGWFVAGLFVDVFVPEADFSKSCKSPPLRGAGALVFAAVGAVPGAVPGVVVAGW